MGHAVKLLLHIISPSETLKHGANACCCMEMRMFPVLDRELTVCVSVETGKTTALIHIHSYNSSLCRTMAH